MKQCPCHSGKIYKECCEPYHLGESAPTAVDLMRSRYSAYALNLSDYIIKTSHPDYIREKKEIEAFAKSTRFIGLEILDFSEKDEEAQVVFKAILKQKGKDASFTECSLFKKINGRWVYLRGIVDAGNRHRQ